MQKEDNITLGQNARNANIIIICMKEANYQYKC